LKNIHLKGLIITASGVLLLSLESLFIKLTSISALVFSFYISIFMLSSSNFILFFTKKRHFLLTYKKDLLAILLCGFLLGISNILFISAIKNTSVANVVVIFSIAPIFSAFYMYILFKEKSSKNIYISSFFIFFGLYIIFSTTIGKGNNEGNIYAFLCIALFSLAFVLLSRYKNINMFAVISASSAISALISFILSNDIYINMNALYILLFAGLLISPLARLFIGIGTKILHPSEVGLLMLIETIMAPIWVWMFLNEVPAINTFIGGGVILLTLILNSLYLIHINKKSLTTL